MAFGGPGVSRRLNEVDAHIAVDAQLDVLASRIGVVAHFTHEGVATCAHHDGTHAGRHGLDEQAIGLVDGDVAAAGGVGLHAGHHGVEQHATAGGHLQVVGNEDRGTINGDRGSRHVNVATGNGVGRHNAAQHSERAGDVDAHVVGRIKALQTTHESAEREVAGAHASGLGQAHVDVAQRAQLKIGGWQRPRAYGDVAGVLHALVLHDQVRHIAIAIEVRAPGRFLVTVQVVTVFVQVYPAVNVA